MSIPDLKHLGRVAVVTAAAFALLGVQDAEAQRRGPGPRGGPDGLLRGGAANAAERALRLADEIELSDDQRNELETVRQEMIQTRGTEMIRMLELSSEVRAGLREPEALRDAMREHREAMDEARTLTGERIDEILTGDQRERLDELAGPGPRWQGRAGPARRLRRMERRRPGA